MIKGDNCKGEIILWQSLGLKYTTQLSTWLWRDTGCVVNSLVSGHPFGIRKKCLFVALCAYKNYSFRQTQKDKKRLDVCLWECYVNLVNVKRTVCFLVDKWRFDKTDPHWSVSLSKALILVLTLMSFIFLYHCHCYFYYYFKNKVLNSAWKFLRTSAKCSSDFMSSSVDTTHLKIYMTSSSGMAEIWVIWEEERKMSENQSVKQSQNWSTAQ